MRRDPRGTTTAESCELKLNLKAVVVAAAAAAAAAVAVVGSVLVKYFQFLSPRLGGTSRVQG